MKPQFTALEVNNYRPLVLAGRISTTPKSFLKEFRDDAIAGARKGEASVFPDRKGFRHLGVLSAPPPAAKRTKSCVGQRLSPSPASCSDRTGLHGALSDAIARPDVVHDRGRVFSDLAVPIADGATCMSDTAVLGNQGSSGP